MYGLTIYIAGLLLTAILSIAVAVIAFRARDKPGGLSLRPLIERLWLERAAGGQVLLGMKLAARVGATARPEAVLESLGMGGAFACYHRWWLCHEPDETNLRQGA